MTRSGQNSIERIIATVKKARVADLRKNLRVSEQDIIEDASDGVGALDLIDDASTLMESGCGLFEREVLDATGEPWTSFDRYEAYAALWYTFRSPDAVGIPSTIGYFLYNALARDLTGRVAFMTKLGLHRMHHGRAPFAGDSDDYPAAMFAIWLGAVASKDRRRTKIPLVKPFRELADSWSKPADLRPIADYHLKELKSEGEFRYTPYELIPVELAAIREVRDSAGLKTVWPEDHPLVSNPVAQAYLGRPKGKFKPRQDAIYKIAVDALRKEKLIRAGVDPWKV